MDEPPLARLVAGIKCPVSVSHGRYDEYSREQVALMVDGIRDFITRNPA